MKSKENLLELLKPLSHFDKSAFIQLCKQVSVKKSTADTYISRYLKNKDIYRLKNGLYITKDFYQKNKNDISYLFYLANIIRTPSYVSSWAALQYYNLTTESIYPITSVTLKVTRNYQTKAGDFTYQSIDKKHFSDFNLVKGKFDFFIASPSKALFDLLYFKSLQFRTLPANEVDSMINELRIDIDEMDKKEQKKFYAMVKKLNE